MATVTNLTTGFGASTLNGTWQEVTTAPVTITGLPLIAFNVYIPTGSVNPDLFPDVTGCGLTWTFWGAASHDKDGTDRAAIYVYSGSGTPTPGPIKLSFNNNVQVRVGWVVDQITGATSLVRGGNAIGASDVSGSVSMTATSADNLVYTAWGAEAAAPSFMPGSGYTAIATSNGQNYAAAFTQYALGSKTSASATWTAPGRWGVAWVELSLAPESNTGSANGSVSWSGSASGSRASAGASSGTLAWSGSTQGAATHSGSANGSLIWSGVATSSSVASGSASGSIDWAGVATGEVPERLGSAEAALAWSGSADGLRPPDPGWTFVPPVALEHPVTNDPLFSRLRIRSGLTVLKTGDSYRTVRDPSEEDIAAADIAYIGGRLYQIDADEAAALINAGYEVSR